MNKANILNFHLFLSRTNYTFIFSGLCEAAYQLAAAVHEEKNPKLDADAPTPFSFNMDEMSDDDDDGKTKTKTLIIIVYSCYAFLSLLIQNVSKKIGTGKKV